jgi:hypothetical protein
VHLLYTLRVYAGSGAPRISDSLRSILKFFLTGAVPWALPVIAAGGYFLWKNSRISALLLFTWITVALLMVAAQGKFYKYHWIPLFPPLLATGATGFHYLLRAAAGRTAEGSLQVARIFSAIALPLAAIGILQLSIVPARAVSQWLALMTGRMSRDQYYAAHTAGQFVAGDNMRAAQFIRDKTETTEGLAVWGNEAVLNFLSGRRNPTRFLYAMPLTEGGPGSPRDAYRREYIAGLETNPPTYFVVGMPWGTGSKEKALDAFPELEGLLHNLYSLEIRIGFLDLYRRN